MSEHAKRIKRELVMKGTILDVYKDTMELPNGKTEEGSCGSCCSA